MVGLLFSFVFMLISGFVNSFISPIIGSVLTLFPDVIVYYANFLAFLTSAFTYLSTILRWLLFTPTMFQMLFVYFGIKFAIFVVACHIRLIVLLYNTIKP